MTTTASRTDLETLLELNRDYISPVQSSDVRRFDEIVADDFLCSHPDGQLGAGRYTDCWARRNGKWLAVSAHVTRL